MNSQKGKLVAIASPAFPAVEARQHLSELFAAHHRRVLMAAYRITGDMSDAEDVAQSVFLRLAGSSGSEISNEGSYLYRAAINGALDLLRRRKALKSEALDEAEGVASRGAGSHPDAEFSDRELLERLRMAMLDLSPRAAEMFALRYVEEMDNREIAVLMQTSQAVVAVTLHQARSRLKQRLKVDRGR